MLYFSVIWLSQSVCSLLNLPLNDYKHAAALPLLISTLSLHVLPGSFNHLSWNYSWVWMELNTLCRFVSAYSLWTLLSGRRYKQLWSYVSHNANDLMFPTRAAVRSFHWNLLMSIINQKKSISIPGCTMLMFSSGAFWSVDFIAITYFIT